MPKACAGPPSRQEVALVEQPDRIDEAGARPALRRQAPVEAFGQVARLDHRIEMMLARDRLRAATGLPHAAPGPDRPHVRVVAQRIDQPLVRHIAVEHDDGGIVEPDQLVGLLPQALVPLLNVAAEQAVKGKVFDEEALLAHDPDRLRHGEEHRLQRLRAPPRDREHPAQMAHADAIRGHEQDPALAARRTCSLDGSARPADQIAQALPRAPPGRTAAPPAPSRARSGERTPAGRHGARVPARGPRGARHRWRRRRTGSGSAVAGSSPRRSPSLR